jgi:hypothetical protein
VSFLSGRAQHGSRTPDRSPAAYERKKQRETARQRKISVASREIAASCPPVRQPARRAAALDSLLTFCLTYFPKRFTLAFCDDHKGVIADYERVILHGGLVCVAMPRGSGKTSIAEVASIWAVFKGLHPMLGLYAATGDASIEIADSIYGELEQNDLLFEDFPEVCYPIRCLEGIPQRRLLWNGELVHQRRTKREIRLPTLPANPAAGAIIKTAGMTGRIRGMKHRASDGRILRPSLVIIDDPQTDKSAASDKQNDDREKTINATILKSAGPGKKMSAIMTVTVIRAGDLAARHLDRQKHPEWNGRVTKLLYAEPANKDLWAQYAELRRDGQANGDEGAAATEFYRQHRAEMDRGAVPAWLERFNPDELSAVQHALNRQIDNPESFACEDQNEPPDPAKEADQTRPEHVFAKRIGVARGLLPLPTEYLACGVDVQKTLLYWVVVAAETNATAHVVDYGCWPQQRSTYFRLRDAEPTFANLFKGQELATQIYNALAQFTDWMALREFTRDDGSIRRVGKIVVDARYETNVIYRVARQSLHQGLILPALGLRMKSGTMGDKPTKMGEISRHDFRIPPLAAGKPVRTVTFDSDRWMTRAHQAIRADAGAPGTLTLFNAETYAHRMYADHLCAEYSQMVVRNGTAKLEWELRPGKPDNHWLDGTKLGLMGCYVCGAEPVWSKPEGRKKWTVDPSRIVGR